MKRVLRKSVKSIVKKIDILYCELVLSRAITRHANFEKLIRNCNIDHHIELLLSLPSEHASQLLQLLVKSKSQFGQELFVLSDLNFKKKGYFVEFGATDGIDKSNTYLLEKEFGWNGILAEPAKCWHHNLRANRNCHIETDCVWLDSNSVLTFNEVDAAGFSTINTYSSTDMHSQVRKDGKIYNVKTISLSDLLDKHNAPNEIDYLSIDTEGSEFDILNNFDFDKYQFKAITCEHNFTTARNKIHSLLSSRGYTRKFESVSFVDDWYVKNK